MIAAGGLYWLSRIPVDGSYVSDILPGLLVVSIGMGGVFTGLTTAANAGVDAGQGRPRRRAAQHRPAARRGARAGDSLGGRHRTDEVAS